MASPQRRAETKRLAQAAVEAAERSWAVFPCRPGDKRPCIERWEDRASADPAHVRGAWLDRWTGCNIGIACAPSRLVVVDLDTPAHSGQLPEAARTEPAVRNGADVLAALAGRAGQPWPLTYTVRTPSGGTHLYFQALPSSEIRNSAGRVGPMVDVRAAGGYIVAAGSVTRGRAYEVLDGRDPVALPGWLADLAASPLPARADTGARRPVTSSLYERLRGVVETVISSEPGTRNGRLYWAACRAGELVAAGQVDRDTAERVLLDAALAAGLRGGELEARRTIESGMRATG